jgi:hypothetical protein
VQEKPKPDDEAKPDGGKAEVEVTTGTPVAFGVAACTNRDPAVAGRTAVGDAVERLGVPAKGIVFFECFPKTTTATVTDEEGRQRQEEREVPDKDKERRLLDAVSEAAGKTPAIGCRARSLVAEGVQPADTVAVLAVVAGGQHAVPPNRRGKPHRHASVGLDAPASHRGAVGAFRSPQANWMASR